MTGMPNLSKASDTFTILEDTYISKMQPAFAFRNGKKDAQAYGCIYTVQVE